MEGELERLSKVWLAVLGCICYCYFIASKIPKGMLRLISLLPIFYLFTILPLSLTTILPTGVTAFFITWLANFKLLLFAFDSGPLSSHPLKSFPLFLSLACLPIKFQENKKLSSRQKPSSNSHAPPKLQLSMRTKLLVYAILLIPHDYYKGKLHPTLLKVVYCCMLYFFLDVVIGICVGLVRVVFGIELEMPSDEPYLATSLQDFWGKRWNKMVSNTLRDTIYRPVSSACGSKLTALMASFLVSGLMHELLYYYIMRVSPTMEVTWFFVLHGFCVVIESKVKDAVAGKWRLHWAISAAMTVGFVISSAIWLFFPPLERNGALEKPIEECEAVVELLKQKLYLSLHSFKLK